MSPHHIPYDDNPTVVAVDKDKHSPSAVRWAVEHLLITNPTLILVHVKTRNPQNHGTNGGGLEANGGSSEDIFTTFRTYGARKKIIVQEEVLEGVDVHSTLLDYISNHNVTNIVLGAPTRNLIARKFWTHDVPTMINKAAPHFCSVYVIAKDKTQSIRPAARKAVSSTPPRLITPLSPARLNPIEQENESRSSKVSQRGDSLDVSGTSRDSYTSYSLDSDILEHGLPPSMMDITQVQIPNGRNLEEILDHEVNSLPSKEVGRLKKEVKQTMNMYNSACKEAVLAKTRGDDLRQVKLDEVSKLEQARLAEVAALQLVEIEKAKCKAAIEAAEKAHKIAEKEMQRRKYAEMKAKREADEKNRVLDVLSHNDCRYRKYTIEEIETATHKFSRSMKIGEGGYGPVFKGKLDHTRVAIKVLRPDAAQGKKQFQQEVEVLSCMRHPNMVLLMGACPEYGCLVYEFMNNGSLEDRLFRKGNTPPIPWGIRFQISSDIATGLLFLHQAKPEPLVHRDLKPANILLDRHYTCKISDVGLARLVPPSVADSVTQYHMTSAAGTFCYIDPEYQQTGKLGTKSDIYSLGVMLLQIITARPPMGLTHHVERAIAKGTFADLLDPTVPDWPVEDTLCFAKLALKCAELRKKDRPDLDKVILPELNRLKELGMKH